MKSITNYLKTKCIFSWLLDVCLFFCLSGFVWFIHSIWQNKPFTEGGIIPWHKVFHNGCILIYISVGLILIFATYLIRTYFKSSHLMNRFFHRFYHLLSAYKLNFYFFVITIPLFFASHSILSLTIKNDPFSLLLLSTLFSFTFTLIFCKTNKRYIDATQLIDIDYLFANISSNSKLGPSRFLFYDYHNDLELKDFIYKRYMERMIFLKFGRNISNYNYFQGTNHIQDAIFRKLSDYREYLDQVRNIFHNKRLVGQLSMTLPRSPYREILINYTELEEYEKELREGLLEAKKSELKDDIKKISKRKGLSDLSSKLNDLIDNLKTSIESAYETNAIDNKIIDLFQSVIKKLNDLKKTMCHTDKDIASTIERMNRLFYCFNRSCQIKGIPEEVKKTAGYFPTLNKCSLKKYIVFGHNTGDLKIDTIGNFKNLLLIEFSWLLHNKIKYHNPNLPSGVLTDLLESVDKKKLDYLSRNSEPTFIPHLSKLCFHSMKECTLEDEKKKCEWDSCKLLESFEKGNTFRDYLWTHWGEKKGKHSFSFFLLDEEGSDSQVEHDLAQEFLTIENNNGLGVAITCGGMPINKVNIEYFEFDFYNHRRYIKKINDYKKEVQSIEEYLSSIIREDNFIYDICECIRYNNNAGGKTNLKEIMGCDLRDHRKSLISFYEKEYGIA